MRISVDKVSVELEAEQGLLDEALYSSFFCTHPLPTRIIPNIIIISSSQQFYPHLISIKYPFLTLFLLLQVGTQHDQIVNVWDWKNNIKVMDDMMDGGDDGGGDDGGMTSR